MNLNVRYGRMTTALQVQPAIQRFRTRLDGQFDPRQSTSPGVLFLESRDGPSYSARFSNRADYDVIRCKATPLEAVPRGLLLRDTLWMATER